MLLRPDSVCNHLLVILCGEFVFACFVFMVVSFGSAHSLSQKNTVYAPDFGKDLVEYQKFVEEMTNSLLEGCRSGAKSFYIAGDLNIELGLPCTDGDDEGELSEICGPQCWQGCDADPGGFWKLMWHDMMNECICKTASDIMKE